MARVFDDIGHAGRATKPVGLRPYEPGALPDPAQCVNCLIVVNDRADGVPRARLALSNGASWDYLAFTIDAKAGQAIDVTPLIRQAVVEQLPALVQQQAPMRIVSPPPQVHQVADGSVQQLAGVVGSLLERIAELEQRLDFVERHGATTEVELRVS